MISDDVFDLLDKIDWLAAVRGASRGFSVLVIGGLVQPLVAMVVPPLGVVWLIVVAVLAFVVAGRCIGQATAPAVHGATAAALSYFLVLPLVYITQASLDVAQLGYTFATAAVVGALVGSITGRRRMRQAGTLS